MEQTGLGARRATGAAWNGRHNENGQRRNCALGAGSGHRGWFSLYDPAELGLGVAAVARRWI